MLHNGIDYTPETTTRRIDLNADTLSRLFAQSNTIDISKFIALLDDEGVTVSGGEAAYDHAALALEADAGKRGCWTQPGFGAGGVLAGPPYSRSFSYEVKATNFTATVKYAKNNSARNIELLTILRPGNTSGMVVYGRQIRREQGDAVLNKCSAIMASSLSKIRQEEQAKFDTFISTLDVTPTE